MMSRRRLFPVTDCKFPSTSYSESACDITGLTDHPVLFFIYFHFVDFVLRLSQSSILPKAFWIVGFTCLLNWFSARHVFFLIWDKIYRSDNVIDSKQRSFLLFLSCPDSKNKFVNEVVHNNIVQ
jgi:hypothetical protein